MPPRSKLSGGVVGPDSPYGGPRSSSPNATMPGSAPPDRAPTGGKPALTGNANAITRGNGQKVGLRRKLGLAAPAAPTRTATPDRPMAGQMRPGFVPPTPDRPKPGTPRPGRAGKKPALTGRANALTRGKGKKIGLRRVGAK